MANREVWRTSLQEAAQCLNEFLTSEKNIELCTLFSESILSTVDSGGNLFACGNGGGHCDAMHFAEEWTGKYRMNRQPIGALALGDASHSTCVGNDYGFEHIFERQIQGLGRSEDLLVGLSTSGNSKNVILAFEAAKKIGMKTVALLGRDGGLLKEVADIAIVVPGSTSDRIQELHIKILHIVIESVERQLFPENYR
jgi:D-sedoheptulose 7-phosphate isomerase